MEYSTLIASPRSVLGKKVRQLRREGVLPANVFGRGLESKAIQLDNREFVRIVRAQGIRTMFKLAIADEPDVRYVFIKGMQRVGGMGAPMHVEFYQPDLNRPVDVTVPVRFTGIAPAVRDLAGTLVTVQDTVHVRTLPLQVPEAVEVDLGSLVGFDVTLTVASIKPQADLQILTDPDQALATVQAPRLRLEEETEAETEAAAEAAAEAEAEAAPAEEQAEQSEA